MIFLIVTIFYKNFKNYFFLTKNKILYFFLNFIYLKFYYNFRKTFLKIKFINKKKIISLSLRK